MTHTLPDKDSETASLLYLMPAAGIAVHILFILSLAWGFLNPLFDDASHRLGRGADFFAVYQSAQNVRDGVSVYKYEPENRVVPYYYPYRYLPFCAYTFGQALLLFSPQAAYGAWILFNELLLAVNLLLTYRLFSSKRRRLIALSMWLLYSPLYVEYFMGQFSFLMASLFFWMLVCWLKGQNAKGDGWWIVSLLVKSNSAILIAPIARTGRWKTILLGGLTVMLLSLPYFLFYPGSFHAFFTTNFREELGVRWFGGNQGCVALLSVLFLRLQGIWPANPVFLNRLIPRMDEMIQLPLLLWTVLLVCWNLLLTIRSSKEKRVELSLLWLLSYFLLYKHVWEHQYVMALPVFIVLYNLRNGQPRRQWIHPEVFWGSFCLVALPTVFWFIDQPLPRFDPEYTWSAADAILFHLFKPLAILILYASLSVALLRSGRSPKAPKPELAATSGHRLNR